MSANLFISVPGGCAFLKIHSFQYSVFPKFLLDTEQLDLFTDYEAQRKKQEEEEAALDREKRMQEAMLSIKKKFGKNAMLKGMNLQEGATARDRNEQIGGHKA